MLKGKQIRWCILGIVFLFFIFKVIIDSWNSRCDVLEEFKSYKFNGMIVNKYIDSTDHSTKTVIIKNFSTSILDTFTLLDWDTSGFYYKIKINDTLIKDRGSDMISLKNRTGIVNYILDFGCDKKK